MLQPGVDVWAPHVKHGFVRGTLMHCDQSGMWHLATSDVGELSAKPQQLLLIRSSEEAADPVNDTIALNDMITMNELNEPTILHILALRYRFDKIYVRVIIMRKSRTFKWLACDMNAECGQRPASHTL
jgi:myosin heavy subunit